MSKMLSTQDQILDVAQNLIKNFGYNGFSYEDIAKAVGIKKPSIHHHYREKSQLGCAVVKRYSEKFQSHLIEIEKNNLSQMECIKSYINLFVKAYGTQKQLCLCGVLGSDLETLSKELRAEIQSFFILNCSWLTTVFEKGKKSKEFHFIGEAKYQAYFFLSTLEGSMLVGRSLEISNFVKLIGSSLLANLTR